MRMLRHKWPLDFINSELYKMAGVGGFEPPHDGIKTRCLTAWLHPNRYAIRLIMF